MGYSPWDHKRTGHSWATEHTQRNFLVRQMWRVEFREEAMQKNPEAQTGLNFSFLETLQFHEAL